MHAAVSVDDKRGRRGEVMGRMGGWRREVEIELQWTIQLLILEESRGIEPLLNIKSFAERKGG